MRQHVGAVQQPGGHAVCAPTLRDERQAPLAAIEPGEEARQAPNRRVVATREVAAPGVLHLDSGCTEVGQLSGGEGSAYCVIEGDEVHAGQRVVQRELLTHG